MYQAPTVGKAFSILELLAGSAGGLTVSDLSRRLGIGKSTVLGIAAALEKAGAVVRDVGTKRYTLGLRLFELGRLVFSRVALKDVARPLMEELGARTGESIFIGVHTGDHVTILETVESTQDLKISAPVGTRLPLGAGATGKVFLAALAHHQAAEWIRTRGLRRYTDNTITDPLKYMHELGEVRRLGYAIDDEEYLSGVRAVAAPIHNAPGQKAAIWVVGFKPSLGAEILLQLAEETRRTAVRIDEHMNADTTQE